MAWLDGVDDDGNPLVVPPECASVPHDGHLLGVATVRTGCQIYEYDGEKPEWTHKGPFAELVDDHGTHVIHHAGTAKNPTWTAVADDSSVTGDQITKVEVGTNILPWASITVKGGSGVLGRVKLIQRIKTDGGKPPLELPGGAQELPVDYTATYCFWGDLPA